MNFKHVYLFLVLSGIFIGKFIPNINKTALDINIKTALVPGQLLRSAHMEKSHLGKASYPVL